VAYLEGWFVLPEIRKRGVGRALVVAAEEWGRSQGCREFASDADPKNDVSKAAHAALGFVDVGLVRCFRKDL
jgi:aminoglycoside 6'-N-acetyltransferase I